MSVFSNKGDTRGTDHSDSGIEELNRDNTHSMKWHNFLMTAMVIRAALTICSGLITLMDWNFIDVGLNASRVSTLYPELKNCEMFNGIALVALGLYVFFARSRLKNYRRNALRSLMLTYVFGIIICLVYTIWASSAINANVIDISGGVLFGFSVIFLIVNGIYYYKRKDLFAD